MPYTDDSPTSKPRGEPHASFKGTSPNSLDDAIRAAVNATDPNMHGRTFVVTHIEVTTVDDPNIGDYIVIITSTS